MKTQKEILKSLGLANVPKIVFINGYGGVNSKKPQTLSKLLGLPIEFVSVDYDKLNDKTYQTLSIE